MTLTKIEGDGFLLITHPYFNCIEYKIWIYIIQIHITYCKKNHGTIDMVEIQHQTL